MSPWGTRARQGLEVGVRSGLGEVLALRARALAPITNDRGHAMDASTAALIEALARQSGGRLRPIGRARADYDRLGPWLDVAPLPMAQVEDHRVADRFAVRVYRPSAARAPGCILYFHGGGYVLGSLRSHDHLVRRLASLTGLVAVAVDYRLAPEHPCPAAYEDGLDAARWARANASRFGFDASRIVFSGDSAGGNLAISTSLSLRDLGEPLPRGLAPIYPMTDATGSHTSRTSLGEGYFLTKELLAWFEHRFLPDEALTTSPQVSVVRADLRGLPPTHVVTAGFDPLRDEGEHFVARARDAGVVVSHRAEDGLIHGFMSFGGVLPAARLAVERVADRIAELAHA